LIPISILADTLSRARQLAELLADDERLDVVDMRAYPARSIDIRTEVLVASGLMPAALSQYEMPVVLLTDGSPAFRHNLRAILSLHASAAEISGAIQAAASDLTVLTSEQVIRFIPAVNVAANQHAEDTLIEDLTPRELQVLRMMANGDGNKEIAVALAISEHTVKYHVAQILGKLNAGSRTEAVSIGIRRGLIPV
jgi:DNA-binding NarL/FixJ family response regulator